MKKLIFIFVLLSCFAEAFAETGYDGTEWGTKRNRLEFSQNAETLKENNFEIVTFPAVVLGRSSLKSYLFQDQELDGVTYSFIISDLPELLKKFENKKKVCEVSIKIDYSEDLEYIIKNTELPEYTKQEDGILAFKLVMTHSMSWELSKMIESKGYKSLESNKQAKEKLFIYDYNSNTRAYIFTGGMTGVGTVVYVPHSQDY